MHGEVSECPDLSVGLFHVPCMLVCDLVESAVIDRAHDIVVVCHVDRIRQVFEWRMRKKGLVSSDPGVAEEEKMLSAALSIIRRKQASATQPPETVFAPAAWAVEEKT